MYIHISTSRFNAKRVVRFHCPDCKKNSRSIEFFQHYRGWTSTCINCGRQWSDGEWLPLDFCRGVRKDNIDSAKRLWRKLKDIDSEIKIGKFEDGENYGY